MMDCMPRFNGIPVATDTTLQSGYLQTYPIPTPPVN